MLTRSKYKCKDTSFGAIRRYHDFRIMKYSNTPMIPSVKERMTNPAYSVEGVASEGWIRGGIPSRELTRDRNK